MKTASGETFIGRHWLYREVEDSLKDDNVAGVLVIGNPGAGKSAWASQLICSRTTSSTIHAHILGYHLCKYSDKNTQMAGKFVRNLAEMIARRLPEYGYLVSSSSYIQRSFDLDCIQNQDPVGCFEQSILTPLRNLKNEPTSNWFIIVDALDECLSQGETGQSIVYLLNNKINRFPHWLKLIMTSRNESEALLHSTKVTNLVIDPEDSRNLEDIEIFVMTRLYQPSPLLHRITSWFGDDSIESTTKVAAALLSKSQGNFLFVKELLNHWEHSRHELGNEYTLPKSLADLYRSYFERLYPRQRSFSPARRVLELLVSTFEPLAEKEIFEVLRMKESDLHKEYDFKNRLKELGHFLKYGENNTITLYHLSLADWLTNENNEKFFVSKKNGHEIFCGYYINLIKDGDKSTLLKYILTLAQHIAFGGWKKAYIKEFLNFPSQTVNSSDPLSNRTLLHLAATINSTDVLKLLLRHFSSIDGVDKRGFTPAFLAAQHGLVDNLALLVKRGADVKQKAQSIIAFYKDKTRAVFEEEKSGCSQSYCGPVTDMPYNQIQSEFFDSSMLHAAAQGGHVSVVRFLLAKNATISALNGVNLTPIQLAAENGHLEVVKILYEAGAITDQTALYLATANNRLQVVDFLLNAGVKDECPRCDGYFYWLDQMSEGRSRFYDDKHLILCQSSLHTAVALGYENIVSRLLSENKNALNCYDYSGRSPLHEAVRKKQRKIADILLRKQPQMIHYKCTHWQEVDSSELDYRERTEYNADVCNCGYTSLHLAARYGYRQLAISLIRKGARVNDRDCSGATTIHVAACHNHSGLIHLFSQRTVGGDINAKTLNGSTPLHSAAACGAVEAINHILYKEADPSVVDDYGLTALHYSIRNIKSSDLSRIVYRNDIAGDGTLRPVVTDRKGHLSGFFSDKQQIKSTDRLNWLDILIRLVFTGTNIDAVDTKRQTTLHTAAQNGLADAVNVLLQRKASLEKKDVNGKTPLALAVENAPRPTVPFHLRSPTPFYLGTKIEDLQEVLSDYEMAIFLLLRRGALLGKCKQAEGSLLHQAILNQQPYIVQLLLLKGASLRCKDSLGRTPLITYLQTGGKFTDVLLKNFVPFVPVECGRPFNYSVYHLLSYHTPTIKDNNFFYVKKCSGHDNLVCEIKNGPLAETLESNPKKHSLLSSCVDAEGFTPLHRAVQGRNLIAVRYLLANGANYSVLNPDGQDALTLAVLYAGTKRRSWEFRRVREGTEKDKLIQAEEISIDLLRYAIKRQGYQMGCDSSKPELTFYHLAAFFGLVEFIQVLFEESDLHALDVNCPNSDGITPMYLAKLFENNNPSQRYDRWRQIIKIIKGHGGEMRYPRQDAEYHIMYRRYYGEFTLELRPAQFRFMVSLTRLYGSERPMVRCSFGLPFKIQEKLKSLQSLLSLIELETAMGELPFKHKSRFQRNMKQCLRERRLLNQYFLKITKTSSPFIVEAIEEERKKFQERILAVMLTRHVQLKYFACMKSLYYKLKPFFGAKTALKTHPRQYEEKFPYFYLTSICENICYVLRSAFYNKRSPLDFTFHWDELYGTPSFVSERLNTLSGSSTNTLNRLGPEWPLEFLLKRFHGVFSQYDYLGTLQFKNPLNGTHLPAFKFTKIG